MHTSVKRTALGCRVYPSFSFLALVFYSQNTKWLVFSLRTLHGRDSADQIKFNNRFALKSEEI
jgi:hypothetical protein